MQSIVIRGARENNLKGIDLDLPRDRLIVVTGLSGSGKSSLAFDTIYAEGQRRYVESLSAYARQFLERMHRPDVDIIDGLSPAISIEQGGMSKNPRSTVGTVTEIYDYLRLLYARIGKPHCYQCSQPIQAQTVQQMVAQIFRLPQGTRFAILAPLYRDKTSGFRDELSALRIDGYTRVNIDGEVVELTDDLSLDPHRPHTIEVYVDRLVLKPEIRSRLTGSLELALKLASGIVKIAVADRPDDDDLIFSERFTCHQCGISVTELTPRLFSFNNPVGACPQCAGLGETLAFDPDLIVPNTELSLKEGAIAPWQQRNAPYYQQVLAALARHYQFDLYAPYKTLSQAVRQLLMHGSGGDEIEFVIERGGAQQRQRRTFEGVVPHLQKRFLERGSGDGDDNNDEMLDPFDPYMQRSQCAHCKGRRLRPEALSVLVCGKAIDAITRMTISQSIEFFRSIELSDRDRSVADRVLAEVTSRLQFLMSVGLDYLTIDRSAATLSGGEGQRVRLATQIGSALVGVIYILDEPSIGLHQRDNERLLQTLLQLRDRGNTVLVVEHDEDIIRAADYLVDLGPGAGEHGGCVVACGTVDQVKSSRQSLTGRYLSGELKISLPPCRRSAATHSLTLFGATHHNLKNIDVTFPLKRLICVTGVSGSGKSSLIIDTLLPAVKAAVYRSPEAIRPYRLLEGTSHLDKIIAIDQSPIGKTPRSNPATYTGVFSLVRDLYATLPEAKIRGFKAGRFSFNVKGGRCEACHGDGIIRVEMHFLPDLYLPCEVCEGQRYNEETLRIRFKGYNIAELLQLTATQALEILENIPGIADKLQTLVEVGLGYLRLGQPASTLSGGEAQRVKLSRELSRKSTGRTLYILDEPTTGLHFADIQILLKVLDRLVDAGNTVVVIEHNLDVIRSADYVLDLGPEGGDRGGYLVASGTPEDVAKAPDSHTGRYLRGVHA